MISVTAQENYPPQEILGICGAAVGEGVIGSGVLVGNDWLLTAAHVIHTEDDALRRYLTFDLIDGIAPSDRGEFAFDVSHNSPENLRLVSSNPTSGLDFSLVKLGANALRNSTVGAILPKSIKSRTSPLTNADNFCVVGHPFEKHMKYFSDGIKYLSQEPSGVISAHSDAEIFSGVSGGPVFDSDWKLVGIATNYENKILKILPISVISKYLKDKNIDVSKWPLLSIN